MKFRWQYVEPILFGTLIYIDANKLLEKDMLKHLYCAYFGSIVIRYVALMTSIVQQTTAHLGIGFLFKKPSEATPEKKE